MTDVRVDAIAPSPTVLVLPRGRLDDVFGCLEACAQLGFDVMNPVDFLPTNRYGIQYATFIDASGQRHFVRSDCVPFNIIPARLSRPRSSVRGRDGARAWRGVVSFGNGLTRRADGAFAEVMSLLLGQIAGPAEVCTGILDATRDVLARHGFVVRVERRDGDSVAFSACLREEAS